MSLSFVGATTDSGSSSVAPTVHGSALTGDLSILDVVVKPYSVSLPTISGWTKVIDTTSGTTASGADTGSVRFGRYVATSATAGATVSVSLSGGNTAAATLSVWRASGSIDVAHTSGSDTTQGGAFAATGAGGIDVASGDWVVQGVGINSDTARADLFPVAGMSGATLGSESSRADVQVTTGDDCRLSLKSVPVTAGSSSSAPSTSYTTGSCAGSVGWTRLREIVPTQVDSTVRAGVKLAPVVKSPTQVDTSLSAGVLVAPVLEAVDASGAIFSGAGAGVKLAPVGRSVATTTGAVAAGVGVAPVGLAITRTDSTVNAGVGLRPVVGLSELPPPLDHRILITTPEYRDALQASTRQATGQVEFIDDSDVVVATFGGTLAQGETLVPKRGVLTAEVAADGNAAVRYSGKISFADASLVPDTPDDLLHPLSRLRARVWHVIKVGALWQRVLMATGHLSFDASDSVTDFGIDCTLEDSFSVVKRALWTETLPVGGLPNHTALERIFDRVAPWLRYQITPTDYVLPPDYELGKPGSDPVSDAREIASAAGLDLHIDRWGTIVAEPVDLQTQDSIGVFREGPGCHMRSLSRGLSTDDLANVVLVMSSNNSLETPVSAMVEDTDPTSPTWVGYGRRYVQVVESDVVTTTAQCRALAQQTLVQARALTETVQLQARSIPHLDPRTSLIDVATNRSRAVGAFEVQALSWAIGEEAGMTVNCAPRRVSILDL